MARLRVVGPCRVRLVMAWQFGRGVLCRVSASPVLERFGRLGSVWYRGVRLVKVRSGKLGHGRRGPLCCG